MTPLLPVPSSPRATATEPVLLLDRLAAIEGFDVQVALRNVGGQMPSLERVLASFVRTYRAGEPQLLQVPTEPGQPAHGALMHQLHTLRGVCATLGAVQLLQALSALEAALHINTADTLTSAAQQVHAGLAALALKIQTALDA